MDRCHQQRVRHALEPEWEARFEPRSYGFRPGRSCQDAIAAIFITCAGPRAKRVWALDADLAAAFDKIGHSFLLSQLGSFPARDMIRDWLKTGQLAARRGAGNRLCIPWTSQIEADCQARIAQSGHLTPTARRTKPRQRR